MSNNIRIRHLVQDYINTFSVRLHIVRQVGTVRISALCSRYSGPNYQSQY